MGMKDVKDEPQSQLAGNLVSGPKQEEGGPSDYDGLVSMSKPVEDTVKDVGPNLVSHQGHHSSSKNPG